MQGHLRAQIFAGVLLVACGDDPNEMTESDAGIAVGNGDGDEGGNSNGTDASDDRDGMDIDDAGADAGRECGEETVLRVNITGKVSSPTGEPISGHVVLRDRGYEPGSILAEASANDAGFFLLGLRGPLPASEACWDYWIEVDSRQFLFGELNIDDVIRDALAMPGQDIDISGTPIQLAEGDAP